MALRHPRRHTTVCEKMLAHLVEAHCYRQSKERFVQAPLGPEQRINTLKSLIDGVDMIVEGSCRACRTSTVMHIGAQSDQQLAAALLIKATHLPKIVSI